MEVILMDFLKLHILNNSGSALRTSLKLLTMKETKRYFKITVMVFFVAYVAFWAHELHFNFTQIKG